MKLLASILVFCFLFACTKVNRSNTIGQNRDHLTQKSGQFTFSIHPINSIKEDKTNPLCGIQISFMNNDQNFQHKIKYESYIHFFSFEFGKHIKLVSDSDTIACEHYNGERYYDVSPISHVFTYFPISDLSLYKKEKFKLVLLKNDFINSENVEFSLHNKFLRDCL